MAPTVLQRNLGNVVLCVDRVGRVQGKRERLDGWRDDLADTLASFAYAYAQHSFVNLNFIPAVDLSFQCDSGFT